MTPRAQSPSATSTATRAAFPAVVRKAAGSVFGVEFPDVPGCYSAGDTLDEARREAAAALRFHLAGLAEDGAPTPSPSAVDDVRRRFERDEDFHAVVVVEANDTLIRPT